MKRAPLVLFLVVLNMSNLLFVWGVVPWGLFSRLAVSLSLVLASAEIVRQARP